MWIRSQKRKMLVKVTSVYIYEKLDGTFMIKGLNECCVGYQDDDFFNLGTYGTEERALEVLDEIQKHIVSLELARKGNHFENLARDCYSAYEFERRSEAICIYQMPEE